MAQLTCPGSRYGVRYCLANCDSFRSRFNSYGALRDTVRSQVSRHGLYDDSVEMYMYQCNAACWQGFSASPIEDRPSRGSKSRGGAGATNSRANFCCLAHGNHLPHL